MKSKRKRQRGDDGGGQRHPNPNNNNDKANKKKEKRRRRERARMDRKKNPLEEAYQGVTFTPIPATGRPGTPHSFFTASYKVTFDGAMKTTPSTEDDKEQEQGKQEKEDVYPPQIVHQHANGIVIVTGGQLETPEVAAAAAAAASNIGETIFKSEDGSNNVTFNNNTEKGNMKLEDIECQVAVCTTAGDSIAAKRKLQSLMLQGKGRKDIAAGKAAGIVRPKDTISLLQYQSVSESIFNADEMSTELTTRELKACVWGVVLEVNTNLTPALFQSDPLLNGYLAIVLPTGPFPPPPPKGPLDLERERQEQRLLWGFCEDDDDDDEEWKPFPQQGKEAAEEDRIEV